MNFSFWWPVGLVVMAGVGYQVSAKEVAGGADPLAALVVTYLVASLTSFLIYAFTGKKGREMERDHELPSCCPCPRPFHCVY